MAVRLGKKIQTLSIAGCFCELIKRGGFMLVALDEDGQVFNVLKILRRKVAILVQVVEGWSDTNPEKFCVRILPM